ncbi:MAG: PH domain-containing protein [Opitutaceae bacterium]|nr:PH domain-containing protein [Opitutaceae bacterium]
MTKPDLPPPEPTATTSERDIWTGHTSAWTFFGYTLFCLILATAIIAATWYFQADFGLMPLALLVIPVLMLVVRWMLNRATSYELTSQRLKIHRGILSRSLEEVELYRVKDYVMDRPLLLRMVGLGNLTLVTSDATTRTIVLAAIPQVAWVREQLRTQVQAERDRKRVREVDIDDPTPPATAA